jgi:hypothetical protein
VFYDNWFRKLIKELNSVSPNGIAALALILGILSMLVLLKG